MRSADGRRGSRVAPAFTTALLVLCVLFSGGTNPDRVAAIGALALAGAALALGWRLAGASVPALGGAGWLALGALAGLTVWSGASIAWSVAGDRSWDYLNLGLVYVAFAVVGVLAGCAGPWAARWAAGALAIALGAAVFWGLLGKVVPALDPEGDRRGRLRGTLDYWNAFALLSAWGILAGLWLARSPRTWGRVAGALLVYGSTVALLLTFSRGGIVVALAAVALWVAVVPGRLETLGALALGALPGLAVAALAFALDGVSRDEQPRDVRADDGLIFGAGLLVGALLVGAAVIWVSRRGLELSPERRRRFARAVAVAVVAAVGLAAAVVVVRDDGSQPGVGAGPERLLRVGSSDRWQWWGESVELFRERPLAGSGAGTFEVARRPIRETTSIATEPHNLALQFLSELGVVGFALLVLLYAAAAVAVVRGVRRLAGDERLAGMLLAVAVAAFGLHALIEFDWDFVALTGPAVLFVGLLAAVARPVVERRRAWLPAVAAAGVGVAALLSLGTPWAARERLEDSQRALPGSPARAAAAAEDAHELNPLSAEALLAWAFAEELRGDFERAGELYAEATELQPENPAVWRRRGAFEIDTLADEEAALVSLTRAGELDPLDPLTRTLLERVSVPG